jgi:holo-[acyl-carrier protein] synthase
MIIGIGTDITEISRIKKIDDKRAFKERWFTEKEQEYFKSRSYSSQTVACNFAAKEAFAKALGIGLRGFSFKEVEILRDGLGKPYIVVYGNAKKIAGELGIKAFHVSLSHCREYATAYVIAEG